MVIIFVIPLIITVPILFSMPVLNNRTRIDQQQTLSFNVDIDYD